MKVEHYSSRADWLAARGKGIGGSDVAAIIGISPWQSPRSLWAQKVGLVEEDETVADHLIWGTKVEGAIIQDVGEQAGVWFAGLSWTIIRSADEPALFCSPDGFVYADNDGENGATLGPAPTALIEVKNVYGGKADQWTDGCPPYVNCQVQHGLYVSGLPRALVGASIGGRRPVWCWVDRDPAWWETHGAAILDFLRRIREEDAPPVSDHPADMGALTAQYPSEEDGNVIALPAAAIEWTDEIEVCAAEIAAGEKRVTWRKNQIRDALGVAEAGLLPDGRGWSWKCDKSGTRVLRATKSKKEEKRGW